MCPVVSARRVGGQRALSNDRCYLRVWRRINVDIGFLFRSAAASGRIHHGRIGLFLF